MTSIIDEPLNKFFLNFECDIVIEVTKNILYEWRHL